MATPNKPTRRRLPILVRHAITLAAVFVIALPLSYIVGQRITRSRQLSKLTSPDDATFEQGLSYLFTHAPDNDWARDAAIHHIDTLEPERAARVLWGLGYAYNQRKEKLPDAAIAAGARLLERAEYAQKFRIYAQLDQLGAGQDPRVLASLVTALETPDDRKFLQAVEFYDANFLWLQQSVPATAWLRWAVLLSHSQAALTQLRAAQLLGDLPDPTNDPQIAESLARLVQSSNATVRSAVLDACAGYARIANDPIPYEQILLTLTTDENQTLARRAWITLGLLNPLSGFSADWQSVEPPIAEAMLWAAVKTNPDRIEPLLAAIDANHLPDNTVLIDTPRPDNFLSSLAVIKIFLMTTPPRSLPSQFGPFATHQSAEFDLLSLALSNHPDAIEALTRSHLRHLQSAAAIAAGLSKQSPTLINGVSASFIRQHPDTTAQQLHAMSDTQLADLGLERVDALVTLLDIAETAPDRDNRYEQIAMLKLALWMRGDLGDDFIQEAEAMLEDELLPTSTVLMCLLHMHRPVALHYLFDPPSDSTIDLYDLFVNQRWWHVFSRLVPDPDLDLWLWGDPGAQAFQFEVMRQWVQVNRWRLERGWWPGGAEAE